VRINSDMNLCQTRRAQQPRLVVRCVRRVWATTKQRTSQARLCRAEAHLALLPPADYTMATLCDSTHFKARDHLCPVVIACRQAVDGLVGEERRANDAHTLSPLQCRERRAQHRRPVI
jgi:hypothetical protein